MRLASPKVSTQGNGFARYFLLWLFVPIACCGLGCQPNPEATSDTATPPASEPLPAQRAAAGVGEQGATLLEHNQAQQILSGPASQLFQVRQRAVFDIQIPQALNLYKASHGRAPRSHEEFVREVLEPNAIELPELRSGMVYQFNTELEELWVYPEGQVP